MQLGSFGIRVVKRDGRVEEFTPEKLVVSALKSGATPESARKVALIATAKLLEQGVSEVTAKDLTRTMLELLRKENEEWYSNWILFDRAVKRRETEKELKES